MSNYRGFRVGQQTPCVSKDGFPFLPTRSQLVWNHSPDGFEWGYGGSGPAQLALAILLDFLNPGDAVALHQSFKVHFVAKFEHVEWTMTSQQIQEWIKGFMPRNEEKGGGA